MIKYILSSKNGVVPTINPYMQKPTVVGSGLNRIETPPIWDWSLSQLEPDRSLVTSSTTYNIGPGQTYETPGEFPWMNLQPGDIVRIHYRPTPYTDLVYFGGRGEWGKYITIEGVLGAGGERPVISGASATLRTDAVTAWGANVANILPQNSGMWIFAKPLGSGWASAYGYKPGYIHIKNFKFTGQRTPNQMTDHTGTVHTWGAFSSGIYATGVEHFAVTDCEFADGGNGMFVNSVNGEPGQSRWILVRGNYFKGNGNAGSASEHNCYTEAIGVIYEYNYFDQPVTGTAGDNIKERSAGIILRNNFIRNGNFLVSLRDPESNGSHEDSQLDAWGRKLTSLAFMYENVFVLDRSEAQCVVSLGDGSSFGSGYQYRHGWLHAYRNVVISKGDWDNMQSHTRALFWPINTSTALNPTAGRISVSAQNNLWFTFKGTSSGTPIPFALFGFQGQASFQKNWINSFVSTVSTAADGLMSTGTIFDGTSTGGLSTTAEDPGFVNESIGDYAFEVGSPWYNLNAQYPYVVQQRNLLPKGTLTVIPPWDYIPPVEPPPADDPEPDANGLHTFSGADGTPITSRSGKWQGSTSQYECNGGNMRHTAGAAWSADRVWYANAQPANQAVEVTRPASVFDTASAVRLSLWLRTNANQVGYDFRFTGSGVQIYKDETYLTAMTGIDVAIWNSATKAKATLVGNVLTAYINGVSVLTSTDTGTALAETGHPGISMYAGGTANKMMVADWTDNPI